MARIPAPPDITALARRLAALEQALDATRGMRRLRSATISEGDLTITGGGNMLVRDDDGNVEVRVGPSSEDGGAIAVFHPNEMVAFLVGGVTFGGVPVGRGMLLQRDNDADLVGVSAETPGGPVTVRLHDSAGVRAFNTDDGGDGLLDRPYLETPVYPARDTGSYATIDDTTEQIVARGRLYVTHPYLHVQVLANIGTAGASFTLRVRIAAGGAIGTWPLLGSTTIATTTATFLDFGGSMKLPQAQLDAPYSFAQLVITAQRTAGTGIAGVRPYGVTRRGTP